MFKASRLTIRVEDLETSINFYSQKLGFPVLSRTGSRLVAIQGPDNVILLAQKFESQPRVVSAAPISLGLFVDDLESAMDELRTRGIEFEGEPVELAAFTISFFSDPDGTPLFIAQMNEAVDAWTETPGE